MVYLFFLNNSILSVISKFNVSNYIKFKVKLILYFADSSSVKRRNRNVVRMENIR